VERFFLNLSLKQERQICLILWFKQEREICSEPGKEGLKDYQDPANPKILPFLVQRQMHPANPKILTFPGSKKFHNLLKPKVQNKP